MTSKSWQRLLRDDEAVNSETPCPLSLYIHIPFCSSLCYFCACNKLITHDQSKVEKYLRLLEIEVSFYRALFKCEPRIEQLHLGGGTPNFLSPEQLSRLVLMLKGYFASFAPDAEVSLEADPRTLRAEHIETLVKLGFNRLSLGVQDFSPEVQQVINRPLSYELTASLCERCRNAGLRNINLDLIYGLPLQTEETFAATLNKVLTIRPDRVALYGYAHVTWLKKAQKILEQLPLPCPEERLALFLTALNAFARAGYDYIGLDHFALPEDSLSQALKQNRLNRTFMGYTTHKGSRVLAFGISAISIFPQALVQNAKEYDQYEAAVEASGQAVSKGVVRTQDDLLRSEIIESILCQGTVNIELLEEKFGIAFAVKFHNALEKLRTLEHDNLLTISANYIRLTGLGRIFSRNAANVFDRYYPQHIHSGKSVFSQAV